VTSTRGRASRSGLRRSRTGVVAFVGFDDVAVVGDAVDVDAAVVVVVVEDAGGFFVAIRRTPSDDA
jgi:hypothetical protein